ncbi:MAG: hypothetical protein R3F50_21355 [Gammaproteobacteria bacterium]|jgi:hypothetical protein
MLTTGLLTSRRNRSWLLVAALVFLLVQTITLQHTHEGDLSLHPDCQICLKLGTQNDVAVADSVLLTVTVARYWLQFELPQRVFGVLPSPRSRAPPSLS